MLQLSVGILNVWDFTFSSIMIPRRLFVFVPIQKKKRPILRLASLRLKSASSRLIR